MLSCAVAIERWNSGYGTGGDLLLQFVRRQVDWFGNPLFQKVRPIMGVGSFPDIFGYRKATSLFPVRTGKQGCRQANGCPADRYKGRKEVTGRAVRHGPPRKTN